MNGNYRYSGIRLVARKLFLLRHTPFQPQIAAPLETRLDTGVLGDVENVLEQGVGVKNRLNVLLANSLESNISGGIVANIPMGWNEKRFSFILVVDILKDGVKIKEEIFQGYSDHADTVGNIEAGATKITLDPNTRLYFNRSLSINIRENSNGGLIPGFQTSDIMLTNPDAVHTPHTDLVLTRPQDVAESYFSSELQSTMMRDSIDGITSFEVANSSNAYNHMTKLSSSKNDVGGRMLADLLDNAKLAKSEMIFSSSGKTIGLYEDLITGTSEETPLYYNTLKHLAVSTNRTRVSYVTLDEISKYLPGGDVVVSDVTSYNDVISRQTASTFNFNGISDLGDSTLSDNQVSRFQKKVIPFMLDAMLSTGFISMAGSLTNKTLDGRVSINVTFLETVSEIAKVDKNIHDQLFRLLINKLTNAEAKAIYDGGHIKTRDIEMVFDLTIHSSVVSININGHISTIRIPSMSDGLFSSMISKQDSANRLFSSIRTVVDKTLGIKTPSLDNEPSFSDAFGGHREFGSGNYPNNWEL